MSAAPKLLPFSSAVAPEAAISGVRGGRIAGEPGTSPARAALIAPADQEQAEQRLAILQPLLDYDADPKRFATWRMADGRAITSKSLLADHLCEIHKISRRTLFNWQSAYREGGKPALADRQRSDKGQSRWFKSNARAAWAAAYLHLECRQSYRAVYEAICADAELLDLTELPHYDTVRSFLAAAPPYLKAYALKGRKDYRNRMSPYLRRNYYDLAPNEAWVSDHMIHDVEVANDCFAELEWGAPIRLRMTAFEDYRSRYIVGVCWSTQESSKGIATAFRRALERFNPPQLVQFDNGKDYRKAARGAVRASRPEIDEEIQRIERIGIIARVGAQITHCLPHHPQAKPIERMFGTVHQFDKMWHQHYTGGAPHLRPDATSAAMMRHRSLMRHGRVGDTTHPPASFFIALCLEWIEEYHNRPHQGRGMDNRTPADVFGEREVRSAHIDPTALALLMQEHRRLKVRECAVEWTPIPKGGSRRYTFFDDASRHMMHALNETEVIVAWDPIDLDAVAILDDAGHFLTWAKVEQYMRMAPADPETQARIAESMQDRRHLEKQVRGTLETISRTARAIGARTPVERLAKKPALAPVIEAALTHRAPAPKPSDTARAPMSAADIAAEFLEDLK